MSRDPIERSLEIEQAQLRGFARTIAEVEWLLLILVLLYLFFANPALARSVSVLGVLLGFAAFVLVFRYARPFPRHTHFKLAFEILAMLAFLTAVLVASGGVRSPLVNLYLLPVVTAALALGKRAAALVVLLVCLCYPLIGMMTEGLQGLNAQFGIAAVGVLAPFVLVAFSTTLLVDNINTAKSRIRALVGSRRAHFALQHARVRAVRRAGARRGEPIRSRLLDFDDRHRAPEGHQRHVRPRSG